MPEEYPLPPLPPLPVPPGPTPSGRVPLPHTVIGSPLRPFDIVIDGMQKIASDAAEMSKKVADRTIEAVHVGVQVPKAFIETGVGFGEKAGATIKADMFDCVERAEKTTHGAVDLVQRTGHDVNDAANRAVSATWK